MNFRLFICIGVGLFTTYLGAFMLVGKLRQEPRSAPPPPPNFSAREAAMVDPVTGEKTIYREITVTTKFAPGPAAPPREKPQVGALIPPSAAAQP